MKAGIKKFTTSVESEVEYWKFVKQVTIRIPDDPTSTLLEFDPCLVDLPGVRDSNRARQQMVKSYLQAARDLWIVTDSKRAGSDLTVKELFKQNYELLLDGTQSRTWVIVCTFSDNFDMKKVAIDEEKLSVLKNEKLSRRKSKRI